MATLATNALTLADWAKRLGPDGNIDDIIELLSQTNEILTDMVWMEGNLPTGHRTTVRTGLPSATWRMLNYGVQTSKSTTQQIDDACGMLETRSVVDQKLADLQNNVAAFRLSEARAFLEAMNQELAAVLIYGNQTLTPNKFTGLAPRYNLLSAGNGTNIIDAGGTQSDNASIWLVTWGDQTAHGIFPKGSKAGLQRRDLGEVTVLDNQTPPGRYQAYEELFQWDAGFTLRDWRYVVRIANIDISNLIALSSNADLITLMIRAIDKVPNKGVGKMVFYMNRTCMTMLKILAKTASASVLPVVGSTNQFETSFFGIPIRSVDALLNTEARVV